jgi:nucleoside-diphosphate-sugar epimerase
VETSAESTGATPRGGIERTMHVLVIGGTGFIGRHVTRGLLTRGYAVTVLHRSAGGAPEGAREIQGDRRDEGALNAAVRTAAPDVVLDVVPSSGRQAQALVEAARGVARRIVAVSSMDVYRACGVLHGLEPGSLEPLPLREESSALRTRLQTYPPAQVQLLQQVFGWLDEEYDKIPVERAILGSPHIRGTILRLPMVYGPGDPLRRFLPVLKRIADGRREIPLSAALAGWRATKGFVEDVASAIVLATGHDEAAGRIYNVGEPDTLTELEWVEHIARAARWSGRVTTLADERLPPHLRAPGNTAQHWVADTRRIREELGFRETCARHEAIRRTVEWDLAHPPTGFTPHVFDYEAEDRIVSAPPE